MEMLENIKAWLLVLAGIACVVIVLIALLKILTGEENEATVYAKRIKNSLLAFAILLLITNINSAVIKYFPDDSVGIGTIDASLTGQDTSMFSGGTEVRDVQNRKVIIATYNNSSYALVLTDTKEIKSGSIFTLWQESVLKKRGINNVYIWRVYGDAQGNLKGYGKPLYFYSFTTDFSNTELGRLYWCYGFGDLNYINMTEELYSTLTTNSSNENGITIDMTSVNALITVLEAYYDSCNSIDLYGYASQITVYENGTRKGDPINF